MNLVTHWMTVFSLLTHWDAHSQAPDPQADCTTHATSTLRVLLTCLRTHRHRRTHTRAHAHAHTHTGLRAFLIINTSTCPLLTLVRKHSSDEMFSVSTSCSKIAPHDQSEAQSGSRLLICPDRLCRMMVSVCLKTPCLHLHQAWGVLTAFSHILGVL